MVTQEMLVRLGQLLKAARQAKRLNQGEVADAMKIVQGQYSDIERAYIRPGQRRGSVPDDDFLAAASAVLDRPVLDLHAALGRVPSGSPAVQLVREHLAPYNGQISREQVESLAQELDDIARVRVERITGQYQSQSQSGGGKQSQRQKQEVG